MEELVWKAGLDVVGFVGALGWEIWVLVLVWIYGYPVRVCHKAGLVGVM